MLFSWILSSVDVVNLPSSDGIVPLSWFLSLGLHLNPINGTIPTELGRLTLLQELLLFDSELSGPIPSELGLLTSMGWLGLRNCLLSGEIPSQLSALNSSLYSLHMTGNPLLSGTLPKVLCSLNGTCFEGLLSVKPCLAEEYGLAFDCTEKLCGCGCDCWH